MTVALRDGDWSALRKILSRMERRMDRRLPQTAVVQSVSSNYLTCKLRRYNAYDGNTVSPWEITVYPLGFLGSNADLTGDVWPDLSDGDPITIRQDEDGKWYTDFFFDDTYIC